jgi:uncharacterized protein
MTVPTDIIGQGWAFPLDFTGRGGVALVGGDDALDRALRLILATAPGERVMRPDFGCAIWDQLFAAADPNTLGLMEQAVREAVGRWEPRVELERVTARPDEDDPSCVHVELVYTTAASNDHRNLVFPFYMIPREEVLREPADTDAR